MKKILALIMAVAMIASTFVFMIPSSAEETTPTSGETAVGNETVKGTVTYYVPNETTVKTVVKETGGVKSAEVGYKATLSWAGLSNMNVQQQSARMAELGLGPVKA